MKKLTKTRNLDRNGTGGIVATIRSTIKVLVKADNFIRQHETKDWKRLFKNVFNGSDFYMHSPQRTKILTVRSDSECLTQQLHLIQKCK